MFNLLKDVEKYKGIPPYASELYGVYQPLLGWQSNLTKKWVQRGRILIDPRIQSILDAYIKPGPEKLEGALDEMFALPLTPGTGHGTNPYSVLLTKDLNSELLNIIRDGTRFEPSALPDLQRQCSRKSKNYQFSCIARSRGRSRALLRELLCQAQAPWAIKRLEVHRYLHNGCASGRA
jgi:hypothetical protein